MSASVIDVFEFCRLEERLEGKQSVGGFPRLMRESADPSPEISWVLQGGRNMHGHAQLLMEVSGKVVMVCQRCMKPFDHVVQSEQLLVLAKNEDQADEIEELLDDESIDVIVGEKNMSVHDLVEDEVLLSLPSSPRHDVCPDQGAVAHLEEVRKPSPFDVLKGLKQ